MNKIDEIALRIAKNVFNTETHRAWSYEGGDEEIKEFAHALLAELSKDVEPSLYRWKTGHNFEYQFSEQRENAPEYATKYFTHPAPVIASEQKLVDVVPPAWTNLIEYVLQDDLHNRLTPRVVDIAYTAFMLAKQPNSEDGGNSDWFNDTKPSVMEAIAKLRKDLVEFTRPPNTADIEQRVAEACEKLCVENHGKGDDAACCAYDIREGKWREYL